MDKKSPKINHPNLADRQDVLILAESAGRQLAKNILF